MHENKFMNCSNVGVTCRGEREIERNAIIILQVLLYLALGLLSFHSAGLRAGWSGQENFLYSTSSRPAVGDLSTEIKRPGREAEY
jgi:hypothetical protein